MPRGIYNKNERELLCCVRCNHKWQPRRSVPPVQCPGCHSPYWDRQPKNKRRPPAVTLCKRCARIGTATCAACRGQPAETSFTAKRPSRRKITEQIEEIAALEAGDAAIRARNQPETSPPQPKKEHDT